MRKKVTLYAIADALGLSPSTISRVLNNKGRISPQVRKKVLQKALELGYLSPHSAPSSFRKQPGKIAVIYPRDDCFWKDVGYGVDRGVNYLGHMGIEAEIYRTDGHNVSQQIQILEEFLKRSDLAGVSFVPADFTQLDYYINALFLKGTSVSTFNVDAPLSKRLFYVGQNIYQAGKVAGELFCKILGPHARGKILILSSNKKAPSHLGRWQGLSEYVQENQLQMDVSQVYESQNEDQAYDLICQLLKDQEEFIGIFITTAFGIAGVGRALSEAGGKDLAVVGNDLSEEWMTYLYSGIVDFCLYQNPFLQGYLALRLLANSVFLEKKPVRPLLNVPIIPYSGECLKREALDLGRFLVDELDWTPEREFGNRENDHPETWVPTDFPEETLEPRGRE